MSIYKLLSPENTPRSMDQSNASLILRERTFQGILNGLSILTVITAMAATFIYVRQNLLAPILLTWGIFLVIGAITLVRNIPFWIRVDLIAVILFLAGVFFYVLNGVSGVGLLFLLGSVVIITVFGGGRAGIAAAIISAAAIFVIGIMVSSGRLLQPVPISLGSNIGWLVSGVAFLALAVIFVGSISQMISNLTHTLGAQQSTLDQQIQEQTNLQTFANNQGQELERRNQHLDVLLQLSQINNEARNQQEFLNNFSTFLQSKYNLYHVGVYILDETKAYAILRSSPGETGKVLMEQKFRLRVGETGMIGDVAFRREARYAPNVEEDTVYYQNPLLPYTKSELTVPIKARNEVIGVLDLQSEIENAFSATDIRIFELLANSLGTVIVHRELTSRLDQIENEADQASRMNVRKAWRSYLRTSRRNYAFRYRDQEISSDIPESEISKSVVEMGGIVQKTIQSEDGAQQTVLALPIKLRGETLGVLNIHFSGTVIPQDLVQLMESTSNRLGLALENARLLEDIQVRAEREHLVSDISARVRSSTAVEDILSTAAAELGRSFGVSEVLVQLRPDEE